MKKSLLLAGMLAVGLANAQTGKVGINTENPNETLEVNGTLRVDNLPESGVGKIYDGAETAGTTFTGTKMVTADDNGTVGALPMSAFAPKLLVGGNFIDAFPQVDVVLESGSGLAEYMVREETFTLDKKSLVDIKLALSVGLRNFPESNRIKRLGVRVYLQKIEDENGVAVENENIRIVGNSVPLGGLTPNTEVQASKVAYPSGIYNVLGNRTLELKAGKYRIQVLGNLFRHSTDTAENINVRFGGSTTEDTFDVVAYPLEF